MGSNAIKRIALAAVTALLAINIWTGGPLLALWIGSQVQGDGAPSMDAVLVTIAALAVISFLIYRALVAASSAYEALMGTAPTVRDHAPWLRSMRGERPQYPGMTVSLTAAERFVVVSVILASLVFEVWFFFFSGSPLGGGGPASGR